MLWPSVASICFGRNLVLIGHLVQQHPQAVLARAEVLDSIDDPVGVPDRCDIGVGHEIDRLGLEHGDVGDRRCHRARVDDDEVV